MARFQPRTQVERREGVAVRQHAASCGEALPRYQEFPQQAAALRSCASISNLRMPTPDRRYAVVPGYQASGQNNPVGGRRDFYLCHTSPGNYAAGVAPLIGSTESSFSSHDANIVRERGRERESRYGNWPSRFLPLPPQFRCTLPSPGMQTPRQP